MPIEDFLRLPDTKQNDITNAALQEFSHYGYDLASTNRIVAAAGISKGMLFKYFSNKENLFLFLVKKYIQEIILLTQVNEEIDDIFEYFLSKHYVEKELCNLDPKYRLCFITLNKVLNNPDHPVHKKALVYYYSYVDEDIDKVMSKLNESRLREGITPADVRNVIMFLYDGFRMIIHKEPEKSLLETEEIDKKVRLMVSVARNGIYK